jgi:hypothetical protein
MESKVYNAAYRINKTVEQFLALNYIIFLTEKKVFDGIHKLDAALLILSSIF